VGNSLIPEARTGFPVELGGAGELDAAFLDESRTLDLCPVQRGGRCRHT
jgi:hypothetical protein